VIVNHIIFYKDFCISALMEKIISSRHFVFMKRMSCFSGAIISIIGAIVLLAWRFDANLVKDLSESAAAMSPNTAFCFILIGISLLFGMANSIKPTKRLFLIGIVSIVAIISLSAIIEHLFPKSYSLINHALMDLFYPGNFDLTVSQPRFPLSSTSICFILLSLSLILIKSRPVAAQYIILPAVAIVQAALVSQAFRQVFAHGTLEMAAITRMAPHTAIAFLIAILGTLSSNPKNGFISRLLLVSPAGQVLRILSVSALSVPVLLVVTTFIISLLPPEKTEYVYSILVILIVACFIIATYFAVRALEISEGKFFLLMEQAGDGIFLADTNGRLTDVNRAGCEMVGYSKVELIGRSVHEFLVPEEVQKVEEVRKNLLKDKNAHRGEWHLRRKDGSIVYVEACSKILPGGIWQAMARDMTAVKRHEERLQFLSFSAQALTESVEYEDRVKKIAELAVPALADYCIVNASLDNGDEIRISRHSDATKCPRLQEICRFLPSIHANTFGTIDSKGDSLKIYTDIDVWADPIFSEQQIKYFRELSTKSYITAVFIARNRVIGNISLGTSKRNFTVEDAEFLKQVVYRFSLALYNSRLFEEARNAMRAREDILSIVSHDLKNPIAAMDLACQIARSKISSDYPPEEIQKYIEKAAKANNQMKRLVSLLLNFGKLESGTFVAKKQNMSLTDLFRDVEEIFRGIADRSAIALEFSVSKDIKFAGDFNALSQAVSNLTANALKFCPSHSRVVVSGKLGINNMLEISVEDNGPGIPECQQARLFDRFWQPHRSKKEGAGLGLYIVRGVARAHGGDVRVDSKVGVGSKFSICIPIAAEYQAQEALTAS
jgi:PAS domain S-box-containing protein